MEKRSVSDYVWVGTAARYLMDVRAGNSIYGAGHVEGNIKTLIATLETSEFFVSLRLARELGEMRVKWLSEAEGQDEGWKSARNLTDEEQRELQRVSNTLRDAIIAEAEGHFAYLASDGRYAVEKLLEDVGALMGDGVFDALSQMAKTDLIEAGRAIAFELPTAAAFHIIRATEETLRGFYESVYKRDRIAKPRMWGPIVVHLRAKRNGPPGALLDALDSLRKNFRNPTQHPDMTYTLDEVQDLFALAVDAINRMSRYGL